MADNIIQLPRPKAARVRNGQLGHYLEVGYNDHVQVADLLNAGERGYQGLVVSATNLPDRQKSLVDVASRAKIELILDPRTQQLAMPGSFTQKLDELPWSKTQRVHRPDDFRGNDVTAKVDAIANFSQKYGATAVLAPTHILSDFNDPWLTIDITSANELKQCLGDAVPLIYSLAVPIGVLRNISKRRTIIEALRRVRVDALWIKAEHFGSDATGDKTVAYVEALREFHVLGVPVVADHVGGLPSLALLALGAAGGISHGVQVHEGFNTSSLRKPRSEGRKGGVAPRIYVRELGLLLKPEEARTIVGFNQRTKNQFGCRDTHCCSSPDEMYDRPMLHYLKQRAREVDRIGEVPAGARPSQYLDENVRSTSDKIAMAASLELDSNSLRDKLSKKQRESARFRDAIAHLVKVDNVERSISSAFPTREQRESNG